MHYLNIIILSLIAILLILIFAIVPFPFINTNEKYSNISKYCDEMIYTGLPMYGTMTNNIRIDQLLMDKIFSNDIGYYKNNEVDYYATIQDNYETL